MDLFTRLISHVSNGHRRANIVGSHRRLTAIRHRVRLPADIVSSGRLASTTMAKKKNTRPSEDALLLPLHPARRDTAESQRTPIVDTHTHLLSTFGSYQSTYKPGNHETIWDFARAMYKGQGVEAIVDVWCEAPVQPHWKEIADSMLTEESRELKWGGLQYWFVMGAFKCVLNVLTSSPGGELSIACYHRRSPVRVFHFT